METELQIPRIGDDIYVPAEIFLDHGQDDCRGGLAAVLKVEIRNRGGVNYHIVEVEPFPGVEYNWELSLAPDQAALKARFGSGRAGSDPDHRDQFN
ncbi:TPA: hypothetical protein DF272_02760 [Candidatus Falkowbacteria bacterium]|nr:hypothetical protein [Candidatus Falkowbacteria bacterium]